MGRALIIAFCAVLSFVASQGMEIPLAGIEPLIFESKINETLQNISKKLSEYDPYYIGQVKYSYVAKDGYFHFDSSDIVIKGFSNFHATRIRVTTIPPAMHFDIIFPDIHLLIPYYKIDALAVFLPFYGSGFMNYKGKQQGLGGSGKVRFGLGKIKGVKNVKARFVVDQTNLQVTGLLHNEPLSEIISLSTTECYPEFIAVHGNRLGAIVGRIVEELINAFLKRPKPKESFSIPLIPLHDEFEYGNGTVAYDIIL